MGLFGFGKPKPDAVEKAKKDIEDRRQIGMAQTEGGHDAAHQEALKQLLASDASKRGAPGGAPDDPLKEEIKRRKILGYKGN